MDSQSSFVSGASNQPLICDCPDIAVLYTSCTTWNPEKRFWRCPNYIQGVKGNGCGSFHWHSEEVVDDRDMVIMRQRRRIVVLQNSLTKTRKWLKIFIICCMLMFLIIVALMYSLYKVKPFHMYLK